MEKKEKMQEFARRIGEKWDEKGYPDLPFPNQPERSKREDDKQFNNFICANCNSYKLNSAVCRCGALNSMET